MADALALQLPRVVVPPGMKNMYASEFPSPTVTAAETTYFRACIALQATQAEERHGFWAYSDVAEAKIYRAIVALKLPKSKRPIFSPSALEARGFCYGLTCGRNRAPYVPHMPQKVAEVMSTSGNCSGSRHGIQNRVGHITCSSWHCNGMSQRLL